MQRFLTLVVFLLALGFSASAASQPVRGLIVRLQPAVNQQRELPQVARERLSAVLRDSGMAGTHARVGSAHHLVRLDGPQQGEALARTMRRLRLHPPPPPRSSRARGTTPRQLARPARASA